MENTTGAVLVLWLSEHDANTYFATRLGGDVWFESSTDPIKALTTAQGDLEDCGLFEFPSVSGSGEEPTDAMKAAVCEQALMRLLDPDLDSRQGLIRQGVSRAGIVEEEYDKTKAFHRGGEIVIAPRAAGLLRELKVDETYNAGIPWVR